MPNSERATIIQDLYNLYLSEKNDRKKENWRRYVKYCKEVKMICPDDFKKVKNPANLKFIGEMTERCFAIKLGHLKSNKDLYYLLSIAKSEKHRGKQYSLTIFGSIKDKTGQ